MNNRFAAGVAVVGAGVALMAGTAAADPTHAKKAESVSITCDNGKTYDAVVNGNGAFTAAHDINSTAVLVPVSFGPFSGTTRDPAGTVVFTFTDPPMSKGKSATAVKNLVTCNYTISVVSDGSDPMLPAGFTFTGTGSVVGKVTPGH